MIVQRVSICAVWVTLAVLNLSLSAYVYGDVDVDIKMDDVRKKDIMKTLGLKYTERRTPNRKSLLVKKYSAPKFMLNLFNEVQNEAGKGKDFHTNMTERKYLDGAQVDTVISFFKYVHVDAWKHALGDVKLKFKVEFSHETEQVKGGEFKLYKRLPRNRSMADTVCAISIYTIQPEGVQPVLLDTLKFPTRQSGWLTFNVTSAMKQWAVYPLTNYGFQLVVRTATGGDKVNPHDFGIVGMRGNGEKRPYLLAFVNTKTFVPTFTRELFSSNMMPSEIVPPEARRTRRGAHHGERVRKRHCHLQRFHVNFKKIGLDDDIIAPKGYDAHFCEGTCNRPDEKLSNHALIQTLAHLAEQDKGTYPCCAPNALEPISVLYYDENDNIVLKKHADMVATSCACQ